MANDKEKNEKLLNELDKLNYKGAKKKFEQFKKKAPRLKRIKSFSEKVYEIELKDIVEEADWLTKEQRDIIVDEVKLLNRILSKKKQVKLVCILAAIPCAELIQDVKGTSNNYYYEHVMKFKKFLIEDLGEHSSISAWQVPMARLKEIHKRNLNGVLKTMLESDREAVKNVIKIIFKIGLDLPVKIIFARYNHRSEHCTKVATLQLFLNLLRLYAIETLNNLGKKKETFLDVKKSFDTVFGKSKVKYALEEERKKLVDAVHKLSHDENKEIEELREILSRWDVCDIDGGAAFKSGKTKEMIFHRTQVGKALKAVIEFFNINFKHKIEEIDGFEKLDAIVKQLKIYGIHTIPTHTGGSGREKERVLENVMKAKKDYEEIRDCIVDVLKKDKKYMEKLNEKDDDGIITFFRERFFGNPYNVYEYVHHAMRAYKHILTNAKKVSRKSAA